MNHKDYNDMIGKRGNRTTIHLKIRVGKNVKNLDIFFLDLPTLEKNVKQ